MSKKSPKSRRKDELNNRINVLPPLSTKCFVCDEHIRGKSVHLVMGRTHYSKSTYPSKIGELVGDDFMVVVCMEDVLCGRCANLLNHMDKLETDLRVVRRTLTGYLASKYDINHKDLFAKFEREGVCEKRNTVKLTEALRKTPKVYRCELCEFSTTDKNKVDVHMEECVKLPHACALCPKRFASIRDHAKHAVMVHQLISSCQMCSSLFVSEQDVADHMKSHPHCSVCNAAFADESQVKVHTEEEHKPKEKDIVEACLEEIGKPNVFLEDTTEIEFHSCNVCALTFLKASLFNEHMKMHENLKEDCQSDILTTHSVDVSRIDDDLEDLFEKLHAETNDLTKSEKPATNGTLESGLETDPTFFLFNNQTLSGVRNVKNDSNETVSCFFETTKTSSSECSGSKDPSKTAKMKKKKEQCCVCLKIFVSRRKFQSHLGVHVKGGDCKCCVCGKLLSGKALLEHCREHSRNALKSRFCSLTLRPKHFLKSHPETHSNELAFPCTKCDRRFPREEERLAHEDRLHQTDPEALRSHEQRHGTSGEKFQCNECERVFKTKTGLSHHIAVHTGQFKFCCDFCGRGFMSRMVLEEHRRKHTQEERYVCDVCGRRFLFQSTYWIHRKWHDNPYPYICNLCGKLFKHSSLLAVHKRKHTGERPYKCSHCPLTFSVGSSLKRHLILHTGAYPFKCQDCNKGFTSKDKYSSHRAKVHGDCELINHKSESKDWKMVVRDAGESETQGNSCELNLERVWGERQTESTVVDPTRLSLSGVVGLASGSRLVEIVMDDSYQAVATVTVATAAVTGEDPESAMSEAWFN